MSFVTIGKIESSDWYFEYAIRASKKHGATMRGQVTHVPFEQKIKRIEAAQCDAMKDALQKHFTLIVKSFPPLDNLTEFYTHLVRLTLEFGDLKKALSAVAWSNRKVSEFTSEYVRKIIGSRNVQDMTKHKKAYLGRIGSVLKQLKENLEYLEHARIVMYDYPSIKANIFTIAIAGFPNVGKSTLLSHITPAKPEIADYAFTTKKLNVGYAMLGHEKAQVIDTPGSLNRLEKMNPVEQQAYLAMRYVTDCIVFVYDLTDEYPIELQEELLERIRKNGKPIIYYLSKTDILPKDVVDKFIAKLHDRESDAIIATNADEVITILKKKKNELFKTSGIETEV